MEYISALIVFAVVVAVVLVVLSGSFNNHPIMNATNVVYLSHSSSLPALVCGGIATQGWYLYSTSSIGPFENKTVGQCGIPSMPSCSFPSGYYGC